MNNKEKYDAAFMEIFNVDSSELGTDFTAETVEKWDSITQMALINKMEDNFMIMFEIEDIVEFVSYDAGIEILKKYSIAV